MNVLLSMQRVYKISTKPCPHIYVTLLQALSHEDEFRLKPVSPNSPTETPNPPGCTLIASGCRMSDTDVERKPSHDDTVVLLEFLLP